MTANEELCKSIIEKYGKESQIDMIMEECTELTMAIIKLKRYRNNTNIEKTFHALMNVLEEIADVQIMLEQAQFIFDSKNIKEFYDLKIERIKTRIGFQDKTSEIDRTVTNQVPKCHENGCGSYDNTIDNHCKYYTCISKCRGHITKDHFKK